MSREKFCMINMNTKPSETALLIDIHLQDWLSPCIQLLTRQHIYHWIFNLYAVIPLLRTNYRLVICSSSLCTQNNANSSANTDQTQWSTNIIYAAPPSVPWCLPLIDTALLFKMYLFILTSDIHQIPKSLIMLTWNHSTSECTKAHSAT